jgi:hypothetical protein
MWKEAVVMAFQEVTQFSNTEKKVPQNSVTPSKEITTMSCHILSIPVYY